MCHGVGRARALVVGMLCAAYGVGAVPLCIAANRQAPQDNTPGAIARRVGKVTAINGSTITLAPDANSAVNVDVTSETRLSRIAPGETNPKNATPMQLGDLQVGDMVRVFGRVADDGKSIAAASIIEIGRAHV